MKKKNDWFRVDKEGLAQVYARRGPAAPFFELISNAWDEEGVTRVSLEVTAVPGKPEVEILMQDNSTHGFRDLSEARTLFAPSYKKSEAESRGRFNVGEKLFLSLCRSACISSTGGSLHFKEDGAVSTTRSELTSGTVIQATMRMTRADMVSAFEELDRLRSPEGICTGVCFDYGGSGGVGRDELILTGDTADWSFQAKLQSELADADGVLRPTERNVVVQAWVVESDETGWLYEMGIPVVEIGGMFDLNVMQKIPLTVDRDNVRPAFLKRLRAYALNHLFLRIESEDAANEVWVTEAMGSTNPLPLTEALAHILDWRFGEKRVSYDPSDREGSQLAVTKGYAVVHGGSLPPAVWDNVRSSGTIKPAGQVTPSNRAVFGLTGDDISVDASTVPGGPETIEIFERLSREIIGGRVSVSIVNSKQGFAGCYGDRSMMLNLRTLGRAWFQEVLDLGRVEHKHLRLLIHELGHDTVESHLDEDFHKSQTSYGVHLAYMAASHGLGLFRVKS